MKRVKMIAMLLVLALCLQTPAFTVTTQAATAVKSGLKKENGKYYYYYKGKKLKNRWKSTKSGKYYFSKTGAAYAGKDYYGEEKFAIKTIDGKQYGFGKDAKMLKGTQVGYSSSGYKFYVFSSKGVYNKTKSAKLNKAAKYGKSWSTLRKLLGKPSKSKTVDGCYGDGGQDYIYYYKNFTVSTHKAPGASEVVWGINPR